MTKPLGLALLIDDVGIDRRLYCRTIQNTGLVERVESFAYADEALDFLKKNPELEVDVIFLDINMPRMDGFEFLDAATTELREGFAKIVVVMLTTSMAPSDERRAAEYDVVRHYIRKPLTEDHVREVVDMVTSQES